MSVPTGLRTRRNETARLVRAKLRRLGISLTFERRRRAASTSWVALVSAKGSCRSEVVGEYSARKCTVEGKPVERLGVMSWKADVTVAIGRRFQKEFEKAVADVVRPPCEEDR